VYMYTVKPLIEKKINNPTQCRWQER